VLRAVYGRNSEVNAILHCVSLEAPDFRASLSTTFGELAIELLNPEDGAPGSVSVTCSSSSIRLVAFAERGARDTNGSYAATIRVLALDAPVLMMVGRYICYRLTDDWQAQELFKLFRGPRDDAGFYEGPNLLVWDDSILLKYESGLVCLTENGQLRWQTRLSYDDELVRLSAEGVWLQNEHVADGREWLIRWSDGKAAQR
jgi:hypothetical protein